MVGPRPGNPRRDHVAVADRLDLLDLVAVDELVKSREQSIEQRDHLTRVEAARERSEIDDVREEDAGVVEVVRDHVGLGLQALRDLLGKDIQQKRLCARLCSVPFPPEGHQQQRRHERHGDDVEDVEGPDETVRQVGAVRPHDLGENEREHDGGDEGREPRPGALGTVEGDRAERREQRPQDHRARVVEAPEHDHPERGRDQDQDELRRPQEREAAVPGEDGEADDRSSDIGPRRERGRLLADNPVQAAPEQAGREDEECDPDEQPLAEAQVRRVARSAPIDRTRSRSAAIMTASVVGWVCPGSAAATPACAMLGHMKELSLGEAARAIGVSVDTLRRWDRAGKLETVRDSRNQRRVPRHEVERLTSRPPRHEVGDGLSARNRFPGIVVSVEVDGVMGLVEIEAGPHRITAAITRDAVEELGLQPGAHATATVKATSVMIERG